MSAQRLVKPQLRGHLLSHLKKHMVIAITLAVATSYTWKIMVCDPRKKKYADFYRDYDADADYERMKALGVLPPFPKFDYED